MLYLSNFSVNLKLLQNKKGYFLKVLSKKKKKARKTKNPIIYLQNSHVLKNKIFKKCNTSDLLEWLKFFKKLVKLNADMDVKQKELPFIASGNARWYSHF